MSLFGCRTMDGQGSAAGAGTYPLKSTPAAEDTVLLTVVDATKAGGVDIRRTPVANMPVSTPVSTALGLKQDAATAITEGDVQGIVDATVADIPGSTVVADGTDPTKAAAAVSADSATYATTSGTAGTVAAVSGDAVTSGTVAEARIHSSIARDSEVSTAVGITATGFNGNLASTDDTIQELAQKVDDLDITAGTITADTTDPTKAAVSVLADTATTSASVDPVKTSGVPGMMSVFEADGTSTLKTGFIGPANSTVNFVYQFPNGIPTPGDTWVAGTALAEQTLPDGTTGTIIPLTHAAGGSSANDTAFGISWDGDTTTAASKNALYDKLASLETQVTDMIAAFSAAGLNSFTFAPSVTYPIYTNDTTPTITVDVTDTSTTYAVDGVNYKLDSGEYAAMTNTTGDTWSVTLPTQAAGTYDLQFNAADDKSTPNTGESSVYTDALIVDLTAPVIVAGADSTHDGSTPVTATMVLTELYPDPDTLLYTVTGGTPASGTWTGTYPNYSLEVTPTGTDDIVVTSSASDPAGNVATGTDLEQTFAYSSGASICDTILDGWTLDNTPNGINGHNLTATDVTYGTTTPPEGTHYAIFNGTTSVLTSTSTDFQVGAQDYSTSMWFNLAASANQGLLGQGDTNQNGYQIGIEYQSDARYLEIIHYNAYNEGRVITTFAPSTSTWYHIVTSWDYSAGEVTIWVSQNTFGDTLNGVVSALTVTPAASANNFTIGSSALLGGFEGLIDNPVIDKGHTTDATGAEALFDGGCQ